MSDEIPPGEVDSFGIDLDRRPQLELVSFPGTHAVRTAVSPDCSFQLLQETLDRAQSEVLIYLYNISADHILALLAQARDRGVTLRILYDAKDTNGQEVQKLTNLGVELRVAPSRDPRRVFDVCHQKFAVVDGMSVYLGSANWAASSIPKRLAGQPRKKGNREWMLRIDNPAVAGWFKTLFEGDFAIEDFESFGVGFDLEAREALLVPAPAFDPPTDTPLGDFPAMDGTITPIVSPDNYFAHVKKLIDGATRRVWLQQQYIVGGPQAPAIEKLLAAVAARKAAGVDVRIMVSSRFASGWQKSKTTLAAHGLTEQLRAINLDRFVHCHNKGVIVDDEVVVSSTNWSENSVTRAREAGVSIRNADLGFYFGSVFDDDWEDGWSIDQGDEGPSFEPGIGEDREVIAIHPADEE